MIRILQNRSGTATVKTNVNNLNIVIKPKRTLTIDTADADQIVENLLLRYGFLVDITDRVEEEKKAGDIHV